MKNSPHISHIFFFSLVIGLIIGCSNIEQKNNITTYAPTVIVTYQNTQLPPTATLQNPTHTITPTLTSPEAIVIRAEKMLRNCERMVYDTTYSPDSNLLAVACNDGIYLYETQSFLPIRKISGGDLSPRVIAFSSNGEIIVSGGNVNLYRVSDGVVLHRLSNQRNSFANVSFSADSQMVAEGTDFFINIWRASNGVLLRSINIHTHVTSIAFAPNGSKLATGLLPNKITLWQASDGTWLRNFVGHKEEITSIAFSPDGEVLVSGSYDDTAKIWNVRDGKLLYTLEFTAPVSDVAFSPDGKILATSSNDGVVRLWQASNGDLLQTIDNLTSDWVTSVAFSSDGNLLSAGTSDGFIWQWYLRKE